MQGAPVRALDEDSALRRGDRDSALKPRVKVTDARRRFESVDQHQRHREWLVLVPTNATEQEQPVSERTPRVRFTLDLYLALRQFEGHPAPKSLEEVFS